MFSTWIIPVVCTDVVATTSTRSSANAGAESRPIKAMIVETAKILLDLMFIFCYFRFSDECAGRIPSAFFMLALVIVLCLSISQGTVNI
jgi:hypothetical protein